MRSIGIVPDSTKKCGCGEVLLMPGTRMKRDCYKCYFAKYRDRKRLSKQRRRERKLFG